jgi:formylglycine-generating enzyme required for sulfatase activity
MTVIPPGCFDMGDPFVEGDTDERPLHNVCITSEFYMDMHEVTNSEYQACVNSGFCSVPGNNVTYNMPFYHYDDPAYANHPVNYVDWNQANAYCIWMGKRLPTEAEWEYAARGGLVGKRYPWGDDISCDDANYGGCVLDTAEVGSYTPNGYGLYDVAGNAREWVKDWYSSNYYQYCIDHNIVDDPAGREYGVNKVWRGGGFEYDAVNLRAADRDNYPAGGQVYYAGFRCAAK